MEHLISKETGEVAELGVVAGFDLERKVILMFTEHDGVYDTVALTDDQVERLRAHWRWIAANPQGAV